jgi:hypothetical protein
VGETVVMTFLHWSFTIHEGAFGGHPPLFFLLEAINLIDGCLVAAGQITRELDALFESWRFLQIGFLGRAWRLREGWMWPSSWHVTIDEICYQN